MKHARNIAIIVAIAAVFSFAPGGGDAASLVGAVLHVAFLAVLAFGGVWAYRRFRMNLFELDERFRGLLYGGLALIVLSLAGAARMFESGPGVLLWFALMGGAVFSLVVVFRHWRAYE